MSELSELQKAQLAAFDAMHAEGKLTDAQWREWRFHVDHSTAPGLAAMLNLIREPADRG